ncbi:pyridoxamine 5'-phosphate oxidase [Pseudomonas syringae CC1557]|uniref:Pyridoxamine 5'-phosphate oxidase n=1 Tax=Pseudomonas syringae CC1557 TaxID=1357279 RepID=W0MU94_PSESX|nr:pyridoxamine 5'-phosphate oxidase [Pseudomonas syringae]AHG40795.1 pyridoxamine 5'-phosphate oxidase [Pseudomonas syringae CC1557]
MTEHPIEHFHHWWNEIKSARTLKHPGAMCVSTTDENGFPNARFVDLKSVDEQGFVFCTFLDSQKGSELQSNPQVALTFWWELQGYQVRVRGIANAVPEEKAEAYWQTRSRSAQLTTLSCHQSQPLSSEHEMLERFEGMKKKLANKSIPKPENWGGFIVRPVTIEFLTFRENRLHLRERYTKTPQGWEKDLLQP